MKKEKSIQVDIEVENNNNNPSGLNPQDTMQDAIKRADKLALPNGSSHSGMMCSNKDLRRIVLLVKEHRNLQTQLDKALEAMRDAEMPEKKDIDNYNAEEIGGKSWQRAIAFNEAISLCQPIVSKLLEDNKELRKKIKELENA